VSREGLVHQSSALEQMGEGGLSGPPLGPRALEVIHLVRKSVGDSLCVIGVGGVETGWDVHRRQLAGATLVQLYTGFIYRGPFIARSIYRQLADIETVTTPV
jgi:dihydroorotate dehydrogenase